jgi:hypothetical protein
VPVPDQGVLGGPCGLPAWLQVQLRPCFSAPARAGFHLIHALPGPFDRWLLAPLGDAEVDVAPGQADPKLAHLISPERLCSYQDDLLLGSVIGKI